MFGDVHGNAFAMRAVRDAIRAQTPDSVLNLGDTAWGAADPAGAWAIQAEFAPPSVRGNTDERVAGMRGGKEAMVSWVRSQLPPDVPGTLAALPTVVDIADGEVRAAHGSPRSPWEDLMLTEADGHTRPAHFAEMRERLDGFTFDSGGRVCIVGHTHHEMLAVVDGVTVVNAGPVSRQKDGLPLARWVLLTRQGGAWSVEFRRTPYEVAAAAAWTRAHGPADLAEHEAAWLTTGREP